MTPPTIARELELCLPMNAGVVKVPPKALVDTLAETEGVESPSIPPGPTSGKSMA